jgi:hypothetical protein
MEIENNTKERSCFLSLLPLQVQATVLKSKLEDYMLGNVPNYLTSQVGPQTQSLHGYT